MQLHRYKGLEIVGTYRSWRIYAPIDRFELGDSFDEHGRISPRNLTGIYISIAAAKAAITREARKVNVK